jgi:ubiquinone/menaquinone biosynthesis C-methylase UbiE
MTISRKTYKWYYDKIACRFYDLLMWYCFLPFGGEVKCRDGFISELDFSAGERILDMCCGTGGATSAILRKAPSDCRIMGMDISSGQISVAEMKRQFKNVEFVEGDVNQTGFDDGFFNKVFITHSLHEMKREDRLGVLSEARRILKEGGEVIVLELDRPRSFFLRLFVGLWLFYWLPFNFETPTRKDMLRHGVENEVQEAVFREVTKTSKHRGIFQVVRGVK